MSWWHDQLQAWQEIVFGVVLMLFGLLIEDRIDQWRDRRRLRGWKGWQDDQRPH